MKKSFQSCSVQELEISLATRPSQRTVGETWIPFCLENLTREANEYKRCNTIQINILVYLRSSVTATPPFGVLLKVRRSSSASFLSAPTIGNAKLTSFWRICVIVRSAMALSKNSV